ncbi:hypothetical protein DMENIID0001_031540 [Sergentomyia squamirostris]
MAAVVRVKRKIDEEPLNAFILNCKKRKIAEEAAADPEGASCSQKNDEKSLLADKDETMAILKFAGTVNSQDDNISGHIKKLSKEEAKEVLSKTRTPQPVARSRDSNRMKSQQDRFKIVNCSRTVDSSEGGEGQSITILDIEKQDPLLNQEVRNTFPQDSEMSNFVYDLYVTDLQDIEPDINDGFLENQISICPFNNLTYGSHMDNGLGGKDSDDDDSEDSNAEDNWRNDYPDSDPDSSIDERDMRRAVENFNLDSEDLSTDSDDPLSSLRRRRRHDSYGDYEEDYEDENQDYYDDEDLSDKDDQVYK